jgi:drug/metabolite transporter (DMT)-like permease
MNIYIIIILILFAALIASLSQILFKKGLKDSNKGIISIFKLLFSSKYIILGLIGYVFSLVFYLFALDHAPLSVVYPIFASSFVFVALFSRFILNEKITLIRYIGVFLVFLGVIIVAISY